MGFRLKPATALSAILLVAFALELLAVLSVPVTRSITLCTYQNIQFGVFGYCDQSTDTCSSIGIGYGDVTSVEGFSLPSNARHTLANLLIVHVVAAGLTFILLILTLIAHCHAAAHSSRYLLFILILSLPCFMVSLLAFLVDILLFVPHLDWGGWIVLPATVLIVLFGVLLCIMRRTMSSRKAMKRHINDSSELQNLNNFSSSAFMPDGGMVYGGENVHKIPNTEFTELNYNTTINSRGTASNHDDNVPLNGAQNSTFNNTNSGEFQHPFYPASTDFNQFNNIRNQTPSPSNEYRTPGYEDYNENTGSAWNGAPQAPEYPNYSGPGNVPTASSAVAAAAATAGTVGGTTVAVSQGPGRRAQAHQSVTDSIIPAGTYGSEYDDGASVNLDTYRQFNGNVVPVPRIQNPAAIGQSRSYSTQIEGNAQSAWDLNSQPQQWSSPRQRNVVAPQTAQQGFTFDSNSTLPTTYETAGESSANNIQYGGGAENQTQLYAPPRSARRNQPSAPQLDQNFDQYARQPPSGRYQQSPAHTPEPLNLQNIPNQNQYQRQVSVPSDQYQPVQGLRSTPPVTIPQNHTDLRQMYVDEGEDQFHAPPDLDTSHLQIVKPKISGNFDVPSSPAISDSSHFTSISQRPINPKYFQQPASSQKAASDRTDFVLASNPDFQLPDSMGSASKRGGAKPLVMAAVDPPAGPRARPGKSNLQTSSTLESIRGDSKEGPYGISRGI